MPRNAFLLFSFFMGFVPCGLDACGNVLGVVFFRASDSAVQFYRLLINIGYFCCRVVAGLGRMSSRPFLRAIRIPC